LGASSDFSGVVLVISEKSETVWNRRPGLVGLRLRMGHVVLLSLEQVDESPSARVTMAAWCGALAEGPGAAVALALALAVQRVHLGDLHAEDRLDGVADLGLGGVGVHLEGVDGLLDEPVGLLAHDRAR
jgi:hypothetical protein